MNCTIPFICLCYMFVQNFLNLFMYARNSMYECSVVRVHKLIIQHDIVNHLVGEYGVASHWLKRYVTMYFPSEVNFLMVVNYLEREYGVTSHWLKRYVTMYSPIQFNLRMIVFLHRSMLHRLRRYMQICRKNITIDFNLSTISLSLYEGHVVIIF